MENLFAVRFFQKQKLLTYLLSYLYNLSGTAYAQLHNFPHPIHKKDFDLDFNFPKKLAQNIYIYV